MRSDEMPNYNLKLSHHEKRSLAWKILIVSFIFFIMMFSGGMLHATLLIIDPVISIWMIGVSFMAVGAFGIGYIVRDKLPSRMSARCKRFYYMGNEFGIWHWSRAQVFLADIFLVSLLGAAYGWAAAHTIPILLLGAFSWYDTTWLLYIPVLYCPFWIEVLFEIGFLLFTIIAFIYEVKTWVLSKKSDYCHFEGVLDKSDGMVYDCDPADPECHLNDNHA
jgi:hypothetical protein